MAWQAQKQKSVVAVAADFRHRHLPGGNVLHRAAAC